MLTINYNEKYQMFYLKNAINELLHEKHDMKHTIKSIKEDHFNGCNYINDIKIPLTFPMFLVKYIDTISKNKEFDYNFIGTITNKRKWIETYKINNSIINQSSYGRDKHKKYEIDKDYYNILCKSRFTLTPTGDCPWSYRFFEAIMCLSIPILEDNSNDIYMKDYFCYFNKDKHVYYEDKAIENYNTLMRSKHFLKNIKEI